MHTNDRNRSRLIPDCGAAECPERRAFLLRVFSRTFYFCRRKACIASADTLEFSGNQTCVIKLLCDAPWGQNTQCPTTPRLGTRYSHHKETFHGLYELVDMCTQDATQRTRLTNCVRVFGADIRTCETICEVNIRTFETIVEKVLVNQANCQASS